MVAFLDPVNATAGVSVTYSGGVGGRAVQFRFACAPDLPSSTGPANASGGLKGEPSIGLHCW